MFCQKCHTEILDDSIQFCTRCGTELNKKKGKFSSFSTGNTFKYTSKYGKKSNGDKYNYENIGNDETLKRILAEDNNGCNDQTPSANNHNSQFNYSMKYSGVTKKRQTHDEQFNYSKNYSGVTKKGQTLDEQYNYSKNYSVATNSQQAKAYQQQQRQQAAYQQQQATYTQPITSDDAYRMAFIGKNKESIIKNKFSVPALFFGPLYLIYRKMYVLGITLQVIIYVLMLTLGEDGSAIQMFINLFLAIKFNSLYLNFVNKQVKKIRENNNDKSSTEILNICKKQGNTIQLKTFAILLVILFFIAEIAAATYEIENKNDFNNINNYEDHDYDNNYEYDDDDYNYNKQSKTYTYGDYQFTTTYKLYETELYDGKTLYQYIDDSSKTCNIYFKKEIYNFPVTNYLNDEALKYSDFYTSQIKTEYKNRITWYNQDFYTLNDKLAHKMYAMKDYSTNNIYHIDALPNGTDCSLVIKEITDNFTKKN